MRYVFSLFVTLLLACGSVLANGPLLQKLQQIKENTIIETEGVFSISDDLDYSKVAQNTEFKSLVDNVLKKI